MPQKTKIGQAYKISKIRQKKGAKSQKLELSRAAERIRKKGESLSIRNLYSRVRKFGITRAFVEEHIDAEKLVRDIIYGTPTDRRSPPSKAIQNIRKELKRELKYKKNAKVTLTFTVTGKTWAVNKTTGKRVNYGISRKKINLPVLVEGPKDLKPENLAKIIKNNIKSVMTGGGIEKLNIQEGKISFGYPHERKEWVLHYQLTNIR